MNNLDKIQQILPLGYLYLIFLGILKETITYTFLGINILKYFGITDILFSPIAVMFSSAYSTAIFLLFGLMPFYYRHLIIKYPESKKIKNLMGIKTDYSKLTSTELSDFADRFAFRTFLLSFIFCFIGFAVADGFNMSDFVNNKKLKYNKTLTFVSGESEKVFLVDCNSMYYFYVSENEDVISIAPIGAVKNIKMTR